MAPDKMFSVGEVAARTQCAPSTLRYWESRGEIPTAQRFGLAAIRGWKPDDVARIEQRVAAHRSGRPIDEAA